MTALQKDMGIKPIPAFLIPLGCTLVLLLTLSCTVHRTGGSDAGAALRECLVESGPKIVAILPFENTTEEPGIGVLARTAFYSHFSAKRYYDIEPDQVDLLLEAQNGEGKGEWRRLSPAALGSLFRADFVICGRVLHFDRVFLGVYSQIVLTVGVEMVSCRTGKGVWWKTLTKRSHDGGVPFSLLGVIPAALRSGLHMYHERTVALVDRISRELAADIPEPAASNMDPFHFEIQVASFVDPVRAESTLRRLELEEGKGRIEVVSLEGRIYHRVLVGPFSTMAEAEEVRGRIAGETAFLPIVIDSKKGTAP